jgi:hypothetical protein
MFPLLHVASFKEDTKLKAAVDILEPQVHSPIQNNPEDFKQVAWKH